jgi:D-arabinose 1-dehydrogenase-like Zn-dependent alcohol dehydrogenase
MPRHKFPSIQEEGIDNYLNRTKSDHNNFGAKMFRFFLSIGLNITALKKLMNMKDSKSVKHWVRLIRTEEHNKAVEQLRDV